MQPNNPIVGGTVLRIPAIQSPNFVEGVSGWAIFQDGTAEFNDIVIVGGEISIGEPPNTQIIFNTSGTDPQGDPIAIESFQTNAASELEPAIIHAEYTSSTDVIEMFVQGPESSDAGFGGMYGWQIQSGSTVQNVGPSMTLYYMDSGGTLHSIWSSHAGGPMVMRVPIIATDVVSGNAETWQTLTLQNGWTARGSSFATPGYRLMPDGTVLLRGQMAGGTVTDGTVIATLPTGYTTTMDDNYPIASFPGSSTENAVLEVATNGNLIIFGVGSAPALTIGGVRFPVI